MHEKYKNLVEMWEEGKASSEIAKALNISRGSVMGKIYRLKKAGAILRGKIQREPTMPLLGEEVMKKFVKPKIKRVKKPKFKPEAVFEEQPMLPFENKEITIVELEYNQCKYILGINSQGDALYCGKPQHYKWCCEEHFRLCYVPVSSKSKKKKEPEDV